MNPLLAIGSLFAFFAVALGAYTEHHLRPIISPESYRVLSGALQYQLMHTVVICALAIFLQHNSGLRLMKLAGWLFVIGVTGFSFSIEVATLTGNPHLKLLAPAGGTTLMIAWLVLAISAFQKQNS